MPDTASDTPPGPRSSQLLSHASSRLLVVDMQEKLTPTIRHSGAVTARCRALVDVAGLHNVPVRVTEQYPKGLGPTIPALAEADPQPAAKTAFSAADASDYAFCDADEPRNHVIICGIESHICVLQTAFDLLARLWQVTVVADAIGARSDADHNAAITRLSAHGVDIVTTEMVLFEWTENARSEHFKTVSKIVQELARETTNQTD